MAVVSPCFETFGLFQKTDKTLIYLKNINVKDILKEEERRQVLMTFINWATFMYYNSLKQFLV